MSVRVRTASGVLFALALFVLSFASLLIAQDEVTTPKVDVFVGYSWFNPGLNVNGNKLKSNPAGFAITATYNLTKYFGLSLDGAGHLGSDSNQAGSVMFGPRFIWRQEHFQPFVHGLAGLNLLTISSTLLPPSGVSNDKGIGVMAGGGFDIPINRRFTFRLIEADYGWAHHNFFPMVPNRHSNLNAAELRTGLVLNFGGAPPLPPEQMSCSTSQPAAVLAGEPVSVTANVTNVPPKHTINYKWSSNGGTTTSTSQTASFDTKGLQPGKYTITATATDIKPRKGQGPLTCTAEFTVNPPPPPAQARIVSLTANPTSVESGNTSNITMTVENPGNTQLTYNYTASAGRVSGTGTTATLDTAGAPAGPITVTGSITDQLGRSSSETTQVTVVQPPPPPQASKINTCQFTNDKRRPSRVDNECKAILDDVALRLQREADAKLVVVGHSDPSEKNGDKLAAERAVNSKDYLSSGEAKQQIDPTRIEVRTGDQSGKTADYWLVPAGATFNEPGTQPVNESAVKAVPRTAPHHAAHKKAAAPK